MSTNEEIVQRLDRLIALFSLAFADSIESARSKVRGDAVSAAILDATEADWVASGAIKDAVTKATNLGGRTTTDRLAALVSMGARWKSVV